jgi:hypothetical protein
MNKRYYIISFSITAFLLTVFTIWADSKIGYDDKQYTSRYPLLSAEQLKSSKENFVVVVISTGCPGVTNFMPNLQKNVGLMQEYGYEYYIVNDDPISARSDTDLDRLLKKYEVDHAYFIDNNVYKKNGGFLNPKKRYADFIKDLYPEPKQLYCGYAYYVIFENGQYKNDTYFPTEADFN